jgi:deoxyhypusine synthase
MSYVHIPVDFKAPASQDFRAFCRVMEAFDDRPVFVHCAANKRVSAFVFLYRVLFERVALPEAERDLHDRHMNRVTDTCIPEAEAIRRIENEVLAEWTAADQAGERRFPYEFLYRILLSGKLEKSYQIDPRNSWLLAAAERKLAKLGISETVV